MDITQSKKVNALKNTRLTDEDTYLRYDETVSSEPTSPVIKRKRRPGNKKQKSMAQAPEGLSSYGSLLSSISSYSGSEGSESEEESSEINSEESCPSPVLVQVCDDEPADDQRPATPDSE